MPIAMIMNDGLLFSIFPFSSSSYILFFESIQYNNCKKTSWFKSYDWKSFSLKQKIFLFSFVCIIIDSRLLYDTHKHTHTHTEITHSMMMIRRWQKAKSFQFSKSNNNHQIKQQHFILSIYMNQYSIHFDFCFSDSFYSVLPSRFLFFSIYSCIRVVSFYCLSFVSLCVCVCLFVFGHLSNLETLHPQKMMMMMMIIDACERCRIFFSFLFG